MIVNLFKHTRANFRTEHVCSRIGTLQFRTRESGYERQEHSSLAKEQVGPAIRIEALRNAGLLAASPTFSNFIYLDVVTPKIQDYGVIGDCRSAALISKYGSIEFLCWPRFDSRSIFAAILDRQKGGFWSIAPEEPFSSSFEYIPETNVLQTSFHCGSGTALLTDLIPVRAEAQKRKLLVPDHELIRRLECTAGELRIGIRFHPRAQYGLSEVRIRERGKLGLQMEVGRGVYWLRSAVSLRIGRGCAETSVVMKRGDVLRFSFTYAEQSPMPLPALGGEIDETIAASVAWWRNWTAQCKYSGPYRAAVLRSALALKLLTYSPSGAVVAAATASLPERIGGGLNWDYRYCWLRDASLTIRALLGLGYIAEAQCFLTWLLHATSITQPQLRVLYTVFGQEGPKEKYPPLEGYCGSQPVRIGNAARHQLQLDIYGEVIDAAAQYAGLAGRFDRVTQRVLIKIGKFVAQHWDQPDEGIWEPRSGKANNTHSRLMCWTALDRLLALGQKSYIQNVPAELFRRERDRIRNQIETRAWNEALQSYASTLDGNGMDAALLRLSWYGLESGDSLRMMRTEQAIRQSLGCGNDLLYRYERKPQEGAFGVCGFWGVEQLALSGRLNEAIRAFENLLTYQSDLGLYSEEIDPHTGDALGNIPQAFTHVGLISAALTLHERMQGTPHPAVKVGADVNASGSEQPQ